VAADLRKCMSAWKMDSANSSMRWQHRAVNTRSRADSQMLCAQSSVHHSSLLGSWINIFV
jgi:hypothetical protein